jgi:UDP:flavonoid glycosyltransferase YjiC (YdhE family)
MRTLFVSIGALGHVHPMVPLAIALLERGGLVRWATSADSSVRLGSVGIDAVPAGPAFDDIRAEYLVRYPEARSLAPADRPDHAFPRLFGEVAAELMLPEVLAAAREFEPDLVVHDQAAFAGSVAAAAVGVPNVTHAFGPLTPRHRVEGAAERLVPLWRGAGLEPRPFGGAYDHLYLDIYPASLGTTEMAHVPWRQPLRPVPFDQAADDDATVWPDDGDSRPLVYLTLGTVFRDDDPLRRAATAIAALDVRLLVTVGPTGDPAALGALPSNVRVERYVPQTAVFRHCAAVVSHAGSGTFLAAVGRGIPQLCLPQAADQFLNAAACEAAGVGLTLRPADASATAIASCVRRLLEESRFRDRAASVAAEIARMPSPQEVARVLASVAGRQLPA